MNEKYYIHQFQNGKSMGFFSNSLTEISECHLPKKINPNLEKILLHPVRKALLPSRAEKIFIGFSTLHPLTTKRAPIWIDPKVFFQMILIGGSIGSGKTTLVNRLLAGALNCGMTVAIGEAKGGLEVRPKRAAFSLLAEYLSQRLQVKSYRWPRGNCWFNPLLYLNSASERRTFMSAIASQTSTTQEKRFLDRAASSAALILEYLEIAALNMDDRSRFCTLGKIVKYLEDAEEFLSFAKEIENSYNKRINNNEINDQKISKYKSKLKQLEVVKKKLKKLDFLALATSQGRKDFQAQAGGIKDFIAVLEDEDLLYYSTARDKDREGQPLIELKLESIAYEPSLIVVSQPLAIDSPSSNTVGPIFWEALLNYFRKLGLHPPQKNGKPRQDLAVFLDETHRLPTGHLGDAGDTLREYGIGLVEIMPSLGGVENKERWDKNKHVYQTIFSVGSGVKDVYELMHERLPEYIRPKLEIGVDIQLTSERRYAVASRVIDNEHNGIHAPGDPGVSPRALQETEKYTTLLHSRADKIPDSNGIFWVDLQSPLLANIQLLLEDAISGDVVARKLVDYALGLVDHLSLQFLDTSS